MCMGGGSPKAPPKTPEAPTAPTPETGQGGSSRRRRAGSGTLLTSGQGVTSNAAIQQKTLLGS